MKIFSVLSEDKTPAGTLTVYSYFGGVKASFVSSESFAKCKFGVPVVSVNDAKKTLLPNNISTP